MGVTIFFSSWGHILSLQTASFCITSNLDCLGVFIGPLSTLGFLLLWSDAMTVATLTNENI